MQSNSEELCCRSQLLRGKQAALTETKTSLTEKTREKGITALLKLSD